MNNNNEIRKVNYGQLRNEIDMAKDILEYCYESALWGIAITNNASFPSVAYHLKKALALIDEVKNE
jgi:hypothetical protein